MEVILDSNFIISCVKKKIDFVSELAELGFKTIVPREVLQELKDLKLKVSRDDKEAIETALKVIENQKIKKVGFGAGTVDSHLIKLGKQGAYIATLDAGIKRHVPNKIVILNAGNRLGIERS